ncbi:sn-1-specific diacylglycerol lipase ABHD11-like [Tachypleus tridentatus]|uniref:sn-1-specific diacylglycerol lipase ABHD11-like n=1 Tax=Tachypleus tridentatus TaxID=6853 RepID=UPI003FD13F05
MACIKLRINLLDKSFLNIVHMPQFWLQSDKVWLSQRKFSCQINFHRPLLCYKREIKIAKNHWKNNFIYMSRPTFGAWRLCTTWIGSHKSSQKGITPSSYRDASYESTRDVPKHCQPVVVLHGLLGSKMNWKTMAKVISLKSGRKVFALDARNHGDSPHTEEMDYHSMAADTEYFMDNMGLCQVVLIGHSMGGRTAMTLALKKPHLVEKLVIVDVSPVNSNKGSQIFQYLKAMRLATEQLSDDIPVTRARTILDNVLSSSIPFILTNLIASENGITWRVNVDALERKFFTDLATFPEFSDCYSGETLFICGGKSSYVRKEDHEQIHELFPKAKMLYIEEAGHWVHSERPAQFLDAVLEFLDIKDQTKC